MRTKCLTKYKRKKLNTKKHSSTHEDVLDKNRCWLDEQTHGLDHQRSSQLRDLALTDQLNENLGGVRGWESGQDVQKDLTGVQ
jgi:hypothetical protein